MKGAINLKAFCKWVDEKGGSVEAAKVLPIGDSMVRHVCSGKRELSPEIAWAVDYDTHGAVSRATLLPEMFGPIKYTKNRR